MAAGVSVPLLEREDSVGRVVDVLGQATVGAGRTALIEGAAGIGKTNVLRLATAEAADLGMRVLTARCGELEREFPYGVARQLFETELAGLSDDERGSILDGAARLAAPAIGLGSVGPAGGYVGTESVSGAALRAGEQATFTVVHGLYWLTANLAERQPLLLAVDDLQWADEPSLRFLDYLSRRLDELPAAVVAAIRRPSPDAGRPLVAQLTVGAHVETVRLSPLSAESAATVVRGTFPEADDAFTSACHRSTGGNPFLLRELVRALHDAGIEPTAAAAPQLATIRPAAVERAVELRLVGLSPEARRLARAVAVLGDRTSLRLATALARVPADQGVAVADELTAAEVLAPGRPLACVHPLIRSAIEGGLPPGELERMHLTAARLLLDADAPVDQVAAHLLGVEPAGDAWVEQALHAAGRASLAAGAPEAARAQLRRALAEEATPAGSDARSAVLLDLATAEQRLGDDAAVDHLRVIVADATDPVTRARAARALVVTLLQAGRATEARDVVTTIVREVSEADADRGHELEAELLSVARLSRELAGWFGERLDYWRSRVRDERPGDRLILANLATRDGVGGSVEACSLAARALHGDRLLREQSADGLAWYQAVWVLLSGDRFAQASRAVALALDDARARGSLLGFALGSSFRAHIAVRRDDATGAEADARAAVEAVERLGGWPFGLPVAMAALVDALVAAGRADEAEGHLVAMGLAGAWDDGVPSRLLLYSRGCLRLARGDAERAHEDLDLLRRLEVEWPITNRFASPYGAACAVAIAQTGDRSTAYDLVDAELARAEAWGAARPLAACLLAGARARPSAAEALPWLERALDVLRESPALVMRSAVLLDAGVALRALGRAEDAATRLREALDTAHRSGTSGVAERARGELVALGARPRRYAQRGLDALTGRERQVAELAAGGLTNRQIAQSLFVTARTVEVHLTHAYHKLGVTSRGDLASLLPTARAAAE